MSTAPWDASCESGSTLPHGIQQDHQFLDDLQNVLTGNAPPSNIPQGQDYSQRRPNQNTSGSGASQKDFFHTKACDGIFCITVGTVGTTQKVLVGGRNNSIETLLIKHMEKLDPISWSDLSGQKMTQNYWQLPFLNIKFRSKVAGA